MKLIRLYPHQLGLVFKDQHYIGLLTEGWHLLGFGQRVIRYNRAEHLHLPCNLSILLADRHFREQVHTVEVREQELCLVYKDGLFNQLLKPGRHVFWKSTVTYDFEMVDCSEAEVGEQVDQRLLDRPELLREMRIHYVDANEEGLLLIEGEYIRKLKAGTYRFWRNGQQVEVLKADKRTQQMEIAGQEILTKDKAGLRINFHLQYRITDVERALLQNRNPEKQLYLLLQLMLREYVGTLTLDELLAKKAAVQEFVEERLAKETGELGIVVLASGIRDIILPGEVREIMNQVLVAEKQVQAKVILRREENAATRSLLNTAKLLEDNPMLLRLKELEYVEKIADKVNTISLSGGGQVLEQLRTLFIEGKT